MSYTVKITFEVTIPLNQLELDDLTSHIIDWYETDANIEQTKIKSGEYELIDLN